VPQEPAAGPQRFANVVEEKNRRHHARHCPLDGKHQLGQRLGERRRSGDELQRLMNAFLEPLARPAFGDVAASANEPRDTAALVETRLAHRVEFAHRAVRPHDALAILK
jgi:hypothetical protein